MAARKNSSKKNSGFCHRYYLSGFPLHPESAPFFQEEDVVIDRFVVKKFMASGCRTQVFEAHERVTGHDVALKVFTEATGLANSTEEMLSQELLKGRLVKDYSHVLRSHDIHEIPTPWGEVFALSMEFADGRSLREWLAAQKANHAARTREAPRILMSIAQGLAAIHDAGLFMIDLRPDNLLFVNGVIKIGDLMLAQTKDPSIKRLNIEPAQRGTPDYISPEQESQQDHGFCDPRSDIHAFGVVAYQLVSRRGDIPRKGPNGARVVDQAELAGLAEPVRSLIARCLAWDPAQRYQDGAELLAELRKALQKPLHQNTATQEPPVASSPKSSDSQPQAPSQAPPPILPQYKVEKVHNAGPGTSRPGSPARQDTSKPRANQTKGNPSAAPAPTRSPAAEPQYMAAISEGIKKEAAETHHALLTRIVDFNLPDLYRFEAKARLLPLTPALVQQLKDRIALLEHSVDSLKRQAWQTLLNGDVTLALEFLQQAEEFKPGDLKLGRARQCLELLIKKRKALVQEILTPGSREDNASRQPTLELSQEHLIGYIGVLLGFEEESKWKL
jgi:serine/threonine protein kinase